jgi:predicted TIM-barrel fold metal-dependent hydrolase
MPLIKKIDVHQHAHKMIFEDNGSPLINRFTGKASSADSDESLIYKTLEAMDDSNIEKSFISDTFENIYRWFDVAPERFLPSPGVYGNPPYPSVEAIREEYERGLIMAIGEISTQYNGLAADDLLLEPYFALAEELDIPILIHSCSLGAIKPSFMARNGNPLLLEDVLIRHPKLRIWVGNAGWPFLSEIISLMTMYPNVYSDLSSITWQLHLEGFHEYLRQLIIGGINPGNMYRQMLGEPIEKRLMFGSDQIVWPHVIKIAVDSINSAQFLSDRQRRDIFYNNAKRFLRL